MTELEKIEVFFRGGAFATLILCALLFGLRPRSNRKDISVAALCIGLCAYVLVSSPGIEFGSGFPFAFLAPIAALVPVLVYWAALELFHDEMRWHLWQAVLCGIVVGAAWLSLASIPLGVLRGVCVIVIFVHLVFVVVREDTGDLIAARRQFRRWFLIAIAFVAFGVTTLEITGQDGEMPPALYIVHASVFWMFSAVFLLWAVQIDGSVWPAKQATVRRTDELTPAMRALIDRIENAMSEGLWRQEGLTVGKMAQELNTQDHRLRAAINQGLGHRNFAGFINRFRVEEAKVLLSDPLMAERTVLSIAYDVGFSSLGPFNRAFRAITGMSPTEYRAKTSKS